MLSIQAVAAGGDYHAYLTSEYYLDQAQAVRWMGRGAEALGLTEEVTPEAFKNLFNGYDQDGNPLVQNAGAPTRKKPAWDLTFSAPKDVSALWAVADEQTRERIGKCHEAAVREALDYLEVSAGTSRRDIGSAGSKHIAEVGAKLIVASFGHGASRERDPQLHTHCVVFNAAVRDDGSTGTLLSRPLYRHKMAAGAIYQATLAEALVREMGLSLTAQRHGFGIEGVPAELSREWSKRREQIAQALGAHGSSAAAAAVAALDTRRGKDPGKVSGLFSQWQDEARQHGFGAERVKELLDLTKRRERDRAQDLAQVVTATAEKLLETNSHLCERELVRAAADRLRDGTTHGRDIRKAASDWFQRPEVVPVGQQKGEDRFTTQAVVERERKLLADVKELAGSSRHGVRDRDTNHAVQDRFPLSGVTPDDAQRNKGQREAVEHILRPGAVSVLSGMAGTGKSTVLKTAREVWEKAGYHVTGMALAGIASKNLAEASGIESETLAMRLAQLGRNAENTNRKPSFALTSKTVVVLDEAGMVGTNDLARLVGHVKDAGAKLVLVGDSKQLQPIAAGSPFARIEKDLGRAELTHITRQQIDETDKLPHWRREAVTLFADGRSKEALGMFAERGLLSVEGNRAKACAQLVNDWTANGGVEDPKNHLILAGTNDDVRALNALCQRERLKTADAATKLGAAEVNGERFHQGDRVLFTKKDRELSIENGEAGTITKVSGFGSRKALAVRLDDGRAVEVPLDKYQDVRLGYAMTTHKAQGATVPNAYVLLGGSMQDLHLSYVQASRARETTRFYADRFEAGPQLDRLVKQMAESREKTLALDVLDRRGRGHDPGQGQNQAY
jgi:Ti-type conjugative transfer relaxase TraA